jgi:hypothetical protein
VDSLNSRSWRGGAAIGALHATWPFGKIGIVDGSVTVRVLRRSRTLSVAEVLRVESLGLFSEGEYGPGVRVFFRGKHWEEHVDFYSTTARQEILAELKLAGFKVVEPDRK